MYASRPLPRAPGPARGWFAVRAPSVAVCPRVVRPAIRAATAGLLVPAPPQAGTGRLAGLGDLRAALEGAGLGGEPVLLLLLGLGLLFKRRGRLRRQPELEQVPWRHRGLAADHDDLAHPP